MRPGVVNTIRSAGGVGSVDRVVLRFETAVSSSDPVRLHRVQTPLDERGVPVTREVFVRTRSEPSDWDA